MQTHECRIKLDVAGSHLSIVRVAIYVIYLRHEIFNMQHKESIHEHLFTYLNKTYNIPVSSNHFLTLSCSTWYFDYIYLTNCTTTALYFWKVLMKM